MQNYELYPCGNNNERKRLGLPMIRRVHIFKEQNKWYRRLIDKSDSCLPGYLVPTDELIEYIKGMEAIRMKEYVIICETMKRAEYLWENTLESLGNSISSAHLFPILNIETCDGVLLYFVSTDYWYDRGGRLGRHDWKPLGENYFERMLDEWKKTIDEN